MGTPIEVLRERYADVMGNQAVTDATGWVLPNSAPEFSSNVVIERAKKTATAMGRLMQETFGDSNEHTPER
jgi:hypothetical protein